MFYFGIGYAILQQKIQFSFPRIQVGCRNKLLGLCRQYKFMAALMIISISGGMLNAYAELPVGGFSANIRSVSSNKCFDVSGAAKINGANIIQYTCRKSLNQTVIFIPVKGKSAVYTLKFAHSGQCMKVFIGRRQDGAFIVQDLCNGSLNQQFMLQDTGNNRYQLIAQHTGKRVTVRFSSLADGAKLIQYQQKDSDSQKWQIDAITAAINPIQIENSLPGTKWQWFPIANNHEIEGYASKTAVDSSQGIDFFVNAQVDTAYTLTLYRLGWYNGAGIRQMTQPTSLPAIRQPMPITDSKTGFIEANWTNPYTFTVPPDWVSGYYIAAIVGKMSGLGRFIPFVVTNNGRYSDYLLQSPASTWQAYNNWGGKSLFIYNSTEKKPARKVSFNRPYAEGYGAGSLTNWELNMFNFLEREGYDVSYQTDIDTHQNASTLWTHKALLSAGQSEFWTSNVRDNIEFALSHGQSLGFFGANASYWQIRLESSLTKQDARTVVGYKEFAMTEDPYALDADHSNDKYITTKWRLPPVNRPENALMGIMYVYEPVQADIMISNASHWVFSGTNLNNGDKLPGLLGGLVDAFVDNGQAPYGTEILAHSPVDGLAKPVIYGDMSVYSKTCQAMPCVNAIATVFAVGSLNWSWGLDGFNNDKKLENASVKQITRNVLARLIQ